MSAIIKKGDVYNCDYCKTVAFIAKTDIKFQDRITSSNFKKPSGDCKFGERTICEKCLNQLDITISSKWTSNANNLNS